MLNPALWLLSGGALGWLAFSFLQLNAPRGLAVTVLIGAVAAYLGGSVVAPWFVNAATFAGGAGELNLFALVIASCAAFAAVYLSDAIYQRFGT
jgi:uncharacterized membrane protein YeaQ/YmgE (transglycosylase-associated protein family)